MEKKILLHGSMHFSLLFYFFKASNPHSEHHTPKRIPTCKVQKNTIRKVIRFISVPENISLLWRKTVRSEVR